MMRFRGKTARGQDKDMAENFEIARKAAYDVC